MSPEFTSADFGFERSSKEFSSTGLEGSSTRLELHEIEPFAHGARLLRNPKWDELKASIEASGGLTQPLPVTKRPGDATYTVHQGGNTRLCILKELYAKTGDRRYAEVEVDIKPFTSELDLAALHSRENLCRGGLTFFEQAWGKYRQFELLVKETGGKVTARSFIAHLRKNYGDNTSVETFCRMRYAVEVLYQHIPTCLVQGGMSQRAIRHITTVRAGLEKGWRERKLGSKADFETVFYTLLQRQDKDLAETFLSPDEDPASRRDKRIALDWHQFATDFCHECTIASDDVDFFEARAWVAPVMQFIEPAAPSDAVLPPLYSPSPQACHSQSKVKPSTSGDELRAKAFKQARQIAAGGGFGDAVQQAPSTRFGYRLTTVPKSTLEAPQGAACWSVLAMNLEDRDVDGDATVSKTIGMASITALTPDILSLWSALLKTHARLITLTEAPSDS